MCIRDRFYSELGVSKVYHLTGLGMHYNRFAGNNYFKLEWTNETEAIKQNVNVVLSILLCIAISVGYFFAVTKMLQNGFPAGGIITFLLCSVCILISLVCKRNFVSSRVITFQNMSINQKEEKTMSKKKLIPMVLLIGTFVILFVATFFLPDKIPFHFDVNGEAGWYASKYFILLLTPVPYLIYHQFTHKKK